MEATRTAVLLALAVLAAFVVVDAEEAVTPTGQVMSDLFSSELQTKANVKTRAAGGDILPDRLSSLLFLAPDDFSNAAIKGNFSSVSPDVMARLPVQILIHMSAYFLATCSPRALSAIVRRHPADPVLARSVLLALDYVDNNRRREFITDLGLKSGLSAEVQSAVAEAAVRWWGEDMKEYATDLVRVGTPLLAALPPGYLAELSPDAAAHMLLTLRNGPWEKPNDPSWSEQPPETKRVWMELFKKDRNSGRAQLVSAETDGLKMLWAGATPDEINDLQYKDEDRDTLIRLSDLTKLQVRGFVTKLYPKMSLSSVEMNDLFDWVLDLSPAGLQRFAANETDFNSLPSANTTRASLPTLKQVLEQVVAAGIIEERIRFSQDPGSWGRSMKDVGRLTYLIRADLLKAYSEHRLPWDVLSAVDTYKLSNLQAMYLTNNGQFLDLTRPLKELETFHGLTRAIPTGKLASLRASSVSNGVMLHLLEAIPATHGGRSAVLFNKMRDTLYEPKTLEAVLRNQDPGQYLSLVSARELGTHLAALEKAFNQAVAPSLKPRMAFLSLDDWIDEKLNHKKSLEERLNAVPEGTLSAVLGAVRRQLSAKLNRRLVWTSDTLLSADRRLVRGALGGLSCPDVVALDLVDLPVILAAFNRRRQAAGLGFPKRLHHCLQRAMEDYLAVKKSVRKYAADIPLITALEPNDIQAFGGYLLTTLRPNHIQLSKYREMILSTIGAMTPLELLEAVPEVGRLEDFALQVVDAYQARRSVGARCLFALGNLHMFLPADVVTAIEPTAWKLFVEAAAGRPQSLAVCAGAEQRDAWHRLAIKTFGAPTQWSAGVVAALGDTMAALPVDVLLSVRVSSWRDAADTLAERTVYHQPTHVPGSDHPLVFAEVCRAVLGSEEQDLYYWSVRRLARFYLRATNELLNTVENADKLVRRLQQRSARTHSFQHRNAAPVATTPTTTTTTPTTTTPEDVTENASTTTPTSTTMDDFFNLDGNFDDLATPANWMVPILTSTTTAAPPTPSKPSPPADRAPLPDTVIMQDDDTILKKGDEDASATEVPPLPQDKSTLSPSEDGSDGDLLKRLDESQTRIVLPGAASASAAPSPPSTAVTELPSSTMPSAATLPSLMEDSNLVEETPERPSLASEQSDKTQANEMVDVENHLVNLVRRRRAHVGDFSDEMEHQTGRDVQLEITCDAVRALGPASSLALVLSDPEHMLDGEVLDCLEDLGKLRLGSKISRGLWNKIPAPVRSARVADMGRLVLGLSADEVPQLNLSLSHDRALDTLSVIGQHVMETSVLDAVAKQLEVQNPALRNVVGGASDAPGSALGDANSLLVALGPAACSLPLDLQRQLLSRRGALLQAARSLQGVRLHCNDTCLGELARAATSDAALGPPASWTAEDVHDMGVIVAGLSADQLQQLQRPVTDVEQPISGLTARAVACMVPEQVMALGEHLAMLSPVAASAVNAVHLHLLSTSQEAALLRIRNLVFTRHLGKPGVEDREAYQPLPSSGRRPSISALTAVAAVSLTALAARGLQNWI